MGAVEEGGKVASSIVDTFKSQPIILALVLIVLGLLALLYWTAEKQASLRSHDIEIMTAEHKQSLELISRCIVPKPQALTFPIKPMAFK